MENQPGNMKNQPGTMKNHENRPGTMNNQPGNLPFPLFFAKSFLKNQSSKKILLARAIHREHFLLQCLKKEIATTKVLDLRPLGKVIIFRDKQTKPSYYI